jgi:hypothetical protein
MPSTLVFGALRRAASGLALVGLGLLAAPAQADAPWSLRLPKEEAVTFRGVVNFDSAGAGGGAMLYPAAGAGGFIAAVITHGLLVESAKNTQRKALQDDADKVLLPYRAVLDGIKHPELMRKAVDRSAFASGGKLLGASEPGGTAWVLESAPAYGMTQDERALVLDNSVMIYRGEEGSSSAYQAVIRVVSQPRTKKDPQAFWNGNEGLALKEEIISLLAHSLGLALHDARAAGASDPAVFKTVRYREGAAGKMERAQLIARRCSRDVIRTLRGWLMSVPGDAVGEAGAQTCEPALPGWK